MPMDTAQGQRHTQAVEFALRGVGWSLGLFGLVRLAWFDTYAVLPLTRLQAIFAESAFGSPASQIAITSACSGADALALCAGAILAYPARLPMRIAGAAAGTLLILGLNIVRIGTLGRAAGSTSFELLHLYVWPALLTVAVAGYVFGWMNLADRRAAAQSASRLAAHPGAPAARAPRRFTRRFVVLATMFLVFFVAASPLYLESAGVLSLAAFIARAAARVLGVLGIHASVAGNVLTTARGGFLVTQECIATPLLPIYAAAVLAYAQSSRQRAAMLIAAVPLFIGLGVARLLVVALPAYIVSSPLFAVHAFYQLLLGAVVVLLAAFWRHGACSTAWRRALAGSAVAAAFMYVAGAFYTRALTSAFTPGTPLDDPQGAIALLPSFQLGLFVALSVAVFAALRWRPVVAGLALLGASHAALFAVLHLLAREDGFAPHVRDVRAWGLAGPLLLIGGLVTYGRPRH